MWMRTGNSARPHGNCRVAWAWQGSSGHSCQWALPGKSSWRVAAVICSREAGLCPGINPVSCTNSPVKPSGKFCFHSLIPRSAFLTFFWKDCQELSLPPVSPVQGGALVGAQQAFLSLFRDRSWVTPLCKCALCTHIHQPVLWIGLSPFHPACKSLLPRNTSGKQAGIPERGTEVRKKGKPCYLRKKAGLRKSGWCRHQGWLWFPVHLSSPWCRVVMGETSLTGILEKDSKDALSKTGKLVLTFHCHSCWWNTNIFLIQKRITPNKHCSISEALIYARLRQGLLN